METRTINQIKVFVLAMNPVTDRAERSDNVAMATDRDQLVKWYNDQIAPDPYEDGRFHKVFKKGSVLEWYNPLYGDITDPERTETFGHGIHELWINEDVFRDINIYKI